MNKKGTFGIAFFCLAANARANESPPSGGLSLPEPFDREGFVRAVLERNPGVEAARYAHQRQKQRRDQVSALESPTLYYSMAPLSVGSDSTRLGHSIELRQRVPWPGTRGLFGAQADASARVSAEELRQVRHGLASEASSQFDAYYAAVRGLETNRAHKALMEEMKAAVAAQYETGRVPQQDLLQAEVELSHVLHRRVMLEARRDRTVAIMNGLLGRAPHLSLPPPPATLSMKMVPPMSSEVLQAQALEWRPEIRASRALLRRESAQVSLEEKKWMPDFGVSGRYSSMWAQVEHQWMAGVSLSLPFLQWKARQAAVAEAEAGLAWQKAKLNQLEDAVRVEVDRMRSRLLEAQHVVHLFHERLIPAARAHVDAARIGYETGLHGFSSLVQAVRGLRELEIRREESVGARPSFSRRVDPRESGACRSGQTRGQNHE